MLKKGSDLAVFGFFLSERAQIQLCLGSFYLVVLKLLGVALEPLAIWNKKLEGLDLSCSIELYTSPFAAPEHISGLFCSGRTRMQSLGVFSSSLLLSDVVVW